MTTHHCHELLKEVSLELARETWVQWARLNNTAYRKLKTRGESEESYAHARWPLFVGQARATLVQMLTGPYSEEWKNQISEALILDNQLRAGPVGGVARPLH